MNAIVFEDLGLIGYDEAVTLQKERLAAIRSGGRETVFLLEHTPTITFGRNGGAENLPFSADFFTQRGVALVFSSRGGNITCHFPGQLVIYPLVHMDKKKGGLRQLVHDLEESVIMMLRAYGVQAEHKAGFPGVWIGQKKIASVGMAMKHWISWHGIAVNIATGLSLFDIVTPCGLPGVTATSLSRELGVDDAPHISSAPAGKTDYATPSYAPGVRMEDVKNHIRQNLTALWHLQS